MPMQPELKLITQEFFEKHVAKGKFEVFISELVLTEISRTTNTSRKQILVNELEQFPFSLLEITRESETLASRYVAAGIFSRKYIDDARHVAIATVNQMDVLLSWNFKHLANLSRKIRVQEVNIRAGYLHLLELTSPMQMMNEHE
jgi:hypothetical protein